MNPTEQHNQQDEKNSKLKTWLKRVGFLGFMFFLIKGLMWLFAGKLIIDFFNINVATWLFVPWSLLGGLKYASIRLNINRCSGSVNCTKKGENPVIVEEDA